ncbi:hypothetical protein GCM10010381_27050 [Streptomyces xantholiticus]|nr:hypothetical protein GCM10010381_27050 [Streptomyces xantholiticus]
MGERTHGRSERNAPTVWATRATSVTKDRKLQRSPCGWCPSQESGTDPGVTEDPHHNAGATPAALSKVAAPWRASCSRITRRLADRAGRLPER